MVRVARCLAQSAGREGYVLRVFCAAGRVPECGRPAMLVRWANNFNKLTTTRGGLQNNEAPLQTPRPLTSLPACREACEWPVSSSLSAPDTPYGCVGSGGCCHGPRGGRPCPGQSAPSGRPARLSAEVPSVHVHRPLLSCGPGVAQPQPEVCSMHPSGRPALGKRSQQPQINPIISH